jgi:hypothetical protein
MKHRTLFLIVSAFILILFQREVSAQSIPLMIPHSGTVSVNGAPFNGNGLFKFAIVNDTGTVSWWTNDNTHLDGTEPNAAVTIPVTNGAFSVKLGDTNLGMVAIQTALFNNNSVAFLRVWFSDGATGFQQLSPDRQLVSVPYAYHAETAGTVAGLLTAQGVQGLQVPVAGTVVEIVGVNFTCPADGFVIAQGYITVDIDHVNGTQDNMFIKLSKTVEVGCCVQGWTQVVWQTTLPTSTANRLPASVTARFSCSAGVAERYRINAQMVQGAGNSDQAGWGTIIAQFSPN